MVVDVYRDYPVERHFGIFCCEHLKEMLGGDLMNRKELDFIIDLRVEQNRQHALWYRECLLPLATAILEDSIVAIYNRGDALLELWSFDEGKLYSSKRNPNCGLVLKRYFKDDTELLEAINGTHEKYYINYEKFNYWEAFYTIKDKQVSVGRLESPFLNKALEELKGHPEHIIDIARICAE